MKEIQKPDVPAKPEVLAEGMDEMQRVLNWFNENVNRLETAYQELGSKFEQVNQELEVRNRELSNALQENTLNQKRLNALLASLKNGVIMVDPDKRIAVLNRMAEQLLGVSQEECRGKLINEVFLEESGVGISLQRSLEQDMEDLVQDKRLVQLERNSFPAAFTGSKVIDEEGKLLGAMETITDLTSIKRMEEEIQQDRVLKALGEMAATVAHEIRNPLGGIGGYAGLLARGIPIDDPRRKLVDKIIQGVSSLNKIVSNLLFYTRKTRLQKVRIDLVEWIESILAHAEIEIEKEAKAIVICRDFPEHEVLAEIDPERFQQVVLNLLLNSIQAISGEGALYVEIRQSAKCIELEIRDTGCGISDDDIEQIFTPFHTTKEQGTGLGLAIVKKLVDLHEGSMRVQSKKDEGTSFVIELYNAQI